MTASALLRPTPSAPLRAPEGAGFDLVSALASADVTRVGGAACRRDAASGKHVCGREDWAFVGPYVADLGGKTTRCMWLHPAPRGAVTEIRLADIPYGGRLQARLGLVEGSGPGAALDVELITTARVGRLSADDDVSAELLDVALPAGADRGPLTIRASARQHDWRMGCLALTVSPPAPAAKAAP